MMRKHLQFIGGMIVGSVLFGSVSIIAQQYSVTENPFPVKINGNKVDVEGYNINGSSYFKLRDIGESVGFDVAFENNTVLISTSSSADINNKEDSMTTDAFSETSDVINGYKINTVVDDGLKYYSIDNIDSSLSSFHLRTENQSYLDLKAFNTEIWTFYRMIAIQTPRLSFEKEEYLTGTAVYINDKPYVTEADYRCIIAKLKEICEEYDVVLSK